MNRVLSALEETISALEELIAATEPGLYRRTLSGVRSQLRHAWDRLRVAG